MNGRFHRTLADAAGNPVLRSALDHVAKTPMAGPGALGVSGQPLLELAFVQRAQQDHEDIVAAIAAREGVRAEALMREHARRSRDNKKVLVEALQTRRGGTDGVPKGARPPEALGAAPAGGEPR
jgi:GntR family transcriptional regulator of vanillate catabolism